MGRVTSDVVRGMSVTQSVRGWAHSYTLVELTMHLLIVGKKEERKKPPSFKPIKFLTPPTIGYERISVV